MADAPEKIGRFDYGRGDVRYTSPPLFITGQTEYIRADLVDDAVKALEAAKIVIGMGDKPRKLDDALTWRQCDEKAKAMIDAALTRIKEAT